MSQQFGGVSFAEFVTHRARLSCMELNFYQHSQGKMFVPGMN